MSHVNQEMVKYGEVDGEITTQYIHHEEVELLCCHRRRR
jgi:hypothetical protein